MDLLTIIAIAVAGAAAIRSTWSPCGLSMLSTITPFGERSRGHRYGLTAAWFILGALVGGLTLGLGAAVLAVGSSALGPSVRLVEALAAAAALLAAVADAGVGPVRFPVFRRQVNERWLDQYRSWLYGAGFGWQVGVGLATYIMTAGVILIVVMAALTGQPLAAVVIGVGFGLVRGLTVLLTRYLRSADALRTFHRRFAGLTEPVRYATAAVQAIGAVALAAAVWLPAGLIVAVVGAALIGLGWSRRHLGSEEVEATSPRLSVPV